MKHTLSLVLAFLCACLLCDCTTTEALKKPLPAPCTQGYSHLLALPMQDEAGLVNDWDTTLYVPLQVYPDKKGLAAFEFGIPQLYPHISSRMYFEIKLVNGELNGNNFSAELFLSISNVSDNPFWTHAILQIEGELPGKKSTSCLPVRYSILTNYDTRIHPNNAWYNPSVFQRGIRVKIIPHSEEKK